MTGSRFALLPRDGLFCKDGRGWYTSAVGRGHSLGWPPPSTLRGALRAAYGQLLMERLRRPLSPSEWEEQTAGVRLRRLLALRRPLGQPFRPEHRVWPAPADAVVLQEGAPGAARIQRLDPAPPRPGTGTLGAFDDEAREALWRPRMDGLSKPRPASGFWTEARMLAWLRNEPPPPEPAIAPAHRVDIHVTLDPATQAAAPSMMFSSELLEMLDRVEGEPAGLFEWGLGVDCALPEKVAAFPRGPVGLGGRRRLTLTEPLDTGVFSAPAPPPRPARGLRLLLATPAEFERGWLPDGLGRVSDGPGPAYTGRLPGLDADVVLRAALVPRPQPLSTWDMARGAPRPTRRLVPAGAVYFFQRRDGRDFSPEELRALWLAAWGGGREEGLGLVLPGAWDPPTNGEG